MGRACTGPSLLLNHLLKKVNVAVEDTRRVAQNKRTIFGVGFVPSVVYSQLPILIRRLRHNDNVELVLMELMTLQQVEALKAGRIDIGFGRIPIDDPQIEQEMLFDEPIIEALPCSHPWQEQRRPWPNWRNGR